MMYILKHKQTSQVFGCPLINTYDFEYFGAKFWESEQLATEQLKMFLEQEGVSQEEGLDWQIIEVTEQQLKLLNVRFNNNPARKLGLDHAGKIFRIS